MLDCLSSVLRPPDQQCVTPCRSPHSQLIERQALAAGLLNTGTRRSGEAESGNGELLGNGEETVIVCDGADDYDCLVGRWGGCVGGVFGFGVGDSDQAGERDGWSIDARHEEAAEDDAVEGGVGAALKKVVLEFQLVE